MIFSDGVLNNNEKAIYKLRELYRKSGYTLYKVSKFEEYDLYAHNKNFLVSQNVLTFTDTNGKLLALKPDVTLSIIKNIVDQSGITYKLCYNETVYRTSSESDGFREIMQTGLECIGEVDRYCEGEVIMLAMKSLETISNDYVLGLSHRGMIDGLLDQTDWDASERLEFVRLLESKNVHAIRTLCDQTQTDSFLKEKLCQITELYAPIKDALTVLNGMVIGDKMKKAVGNLKELCEILSTYGLAEKLYLDFSIVSDDNYYDGISFKGYINGIPESVLSGGRYDRLMNRLGKKCGAIGFAVYLDHLERFEAESSLYDVDAVLLYDADACVDDLLRAQKKLSLEYSNVITARGIDRSLRSRKLFKLTKGGIESLETND